MKKLTTILYFIATIVFAQGTPNSLLKNFKPFETPRTNCRPGTIYRISADGIKYVVQDISQIKSDLSEDGTLLGQMTYSKEELLTMLNLDFNAEYVTAEVEIKDAIREYTEQANINTVLWDNDVAYNIMQDEKSEYFLIRETVSSQNITFRFSRSSVSLLTTGKSNLKEKVGEGIDFPFEISKKYNEDKRLFFLEEAIPYQK